MTPALAADLAALFSDFGVPATVGGVAVTAIFDNNYAEALGYTAGAKPMLLLATAGVPDVAAGDAVVVGSVSYTVAGIEPDGTGLTVLRLESA
jgi:hypothetical protein